MDRPKVYVTQEVLTANYVPADKWGDVVFLSVAEISGVPNSLHNRKLVAAIRDRMAAYDPATDFIAPSGSPIITGIVFAIAREKSAVFNVLKWNSRDQSYTPATVDISEDKYVY
jgi:hypothetical protein